MPEEITLDPEQLFVEDPDIPDVRDDDDGQQEESESESEDGAAEQEEHEESVEDEIETKEEVDEDETGEQQDGDSETGDSEDDAQGDEFEIGGKEYTTETLTDYIVELEKGSLRQSDYTKKTQELAGYRKGAEADVAFVSALKDADLMDSISEALDEAGIKNAKQLVANALSGDAGEHPDSIRLKEMESEVDRLSTEAEAEKELEAKVESLAERKEITSEEANEVRKLAEDLYETKGTVLDLDDAYDLWQVRKGKLTVKRKTPTVPKTPSKKRGPKPQKENDAKYERMQDQYLFTD